MSRTYRKNNGFNSGRDDKPFGAKCFPSSKHQKGFDTLEDDHGHYGAGGSKKMKSLASRARRNFNKKVLREEAKDFWESN